MSFCSLPTTCLQFLILPHSCFSRYLDPPPKQNLLGLHRGGVLLLFYLGKDVLFIKKKIQETSGRLCWLVDHVRSPLILKQVWGEALFLRPGATQHQ